MHISAIICTRNRPDLIGAAVASVLANTYPDFELLVVDQSTDERTGHIVRALAASYPNLRYMHTEIAGLSRAYNIGIRETTGEILAFTDDDCVAPADWIESIARMFSADRAVDLLYGQVLMPASLKDHPDTIPTLVVENEIRLTPADHFRIFGMGANFAARRDLLTRIRGFDEVLGGGGPLKSSQDFDLQYRAHLGGATVLLTSRVSVEHYGLRNPQQWEATLKAYGIGDGAFYFKHVRCGDWFAMRLLAGRVLKLATREALNGFRKKPSLAPYLRAVLEGCGGSMRYSVDRRTRLYRTPARRAVERLS
jgi:glycosyltransferase involved in cell wall biosynthesis